MLAKKYEMKYHSSRRVLELLADTDAHVEILSKSDLMIKDIGLLTGNESHKDKHDYPLEYIVYVMFLEDVMFRKVTTQAVSQQNKKYEEWCEKLIQNH